MPHVYSAQLVSGEDLPVSFSRAKEEMGGPSHALLPRGEEAGRGNILNTQVALGATRRHKDET
jgi:hypothetical protein